MLFFYLFRNSESAIRGHQFLTVWLYGYLFNAIFCKATNELQDFALTHNNESFYLQL